MDVTNIPKKGYLVAAPKDADFTLGITNWVISEDNSYCLHSIDSKSFKNQDGTYRYKVVKWRVTYHSIKDSYYLDMYCETNGTSNILSTTVPSETLQNSFNFTKTLLKGLESFSKLVEALSELNESEAYKFVKGSFPWNLYQASNWSDGLYGPGTVVISKQDKSFNVSQASNQLPGVKEKVRFPCNCHLLKDRLMTVKSVIIHLNDDCGWSRERIADWLDELHDSGIINIEFQSWDDKVEVD